MEGLNEKAPAPAATGSEGRDFTTSAPNIARVVGNVNKVAFILWRPEWDAGRQKWQKFPVSPHTGETVNAHDPAHHVDRATADAQAAARGLGVALVLTAGDPLFALDLDHCLRDGQWSPRAVELCQRFAGAYVEVGYSGDGLHIIGSYTGPEPAHGCKNVAEGLELYTSGRFIALTGSGARGSMDADQTLALYQTIHDLFPAPAGGTGGEVPDEGPRSDWDGHADDDDLLAAALESGGARAVFGHGVTFADLWHGDEDALGRQWPDPEQGRAFDASHADAALAQHLAFWTGCDTGRMERLMRRSELAREKWERADYLPRTIARACERQTEVHQRGGVEPAATGGAVFDPDEPGTPDLSHDGLALALGAAGGWNDRARYVAAWGRWLFWTGSRWKPDERLRHLSEVRDFLRTVAADLERWAATRAATMEPEAGEKLQKWARGESRQLRQAQSRANVESTARSNPDLTAGPDQFDADADLLGTPGGVVDLRSGELRAATPADGVTKLTAATPAEPGATPARWLAFLETATGGDRELADYLQRLAGYMLTGRVDEHAVAFIHGPGGDGKSTLINALFELLADYAVRLPAEALLLTSGQRHPTDLASLAGARLAVTSEIPAGRSWNASLVKDLSSGDPIAARRMRSDFFEFRPQCLLTVVGNHLPSLGTVDAAITRRLHLIPFDQSLPPERQDPGLPAILRAEFPAILRWAIEGAVAWYRDGLQAPERVHAAAAEYLAGEDTLGQFLTELVTADPTGPGVPVGELHAAHTAWTTRRGERPWSQRAFGQALRERGFHIRRTEDARRLDGHAMRP